MFSQQPALFTDPGVEYPIYNMDLHFDDYITKCKTIIANTRTDLTTPDAQTIIEANSPFELQPKTSTKVGALLVHGLLDSPFQFRDIGKQLQSQGLLVRSLLLPGHGTVPGALLNVDYHQWLQAVRYGIATLKKDVEHIILVGNSTGASLLLHQAVENDAPIAGAVLLSPPLKIRSRFAFVSCWHPAISQRWKRAAWFHIDPEETLDYVKYWSLPYNAIAQVYLLSKTLKQPQCPLFFVTSQEDAIVCPQTILRFFMKNQNSHSRLLLYTNRLNRLSDTRIETRPSAYPKQYIVNFSHVAMTYSPENPHYGKYGDYKYASHVEENNNVVYGEFLRNHLFYNKWKLKFGLTQAREERLTFNPDFDYMCEQIEQFVKAAVAQ